MISKTSCLWLSLICLCILPLIPANGQIPAFPGAEGAGAFATGGRPNATLGGIVYHVTTLDPDPTGIQPGSLRYGMKNENFLVVPDSWPWGFWDVNVPDSYEIIPRIIVFDIGGTIDIGEVDTTPLNYTIAGQTAPGGITLYGGEFNPGHRDSWDTGNSPKHNNIIIRNISIRTHDPAEKDGLWMPASHSIVDHISVSWYTDEGVSVTDSARDVTVQYSIIGPGWNQPDGDGSQFEGKTPAADISVHHNLYAHNDARVPRVGEKEGPGVELDFRNNVIYNWNDSKAGYSVSSEPSFNNFVNNYYIGGADNDGNDVIFQSGSTLTRIYQSGNLLDRDFNGVADGQDLGWSVFSGSESQQSVPYTVPHGVTQTAEEALETVLDYAGANWWDRHFLDSRVIDQVATYGQGTSLETGQVLRTVDQNDVDTVTGVPSRTRPVDWDTDNDGMPNHWEIERGLDPDISDWDLDDDQDGYVNLEEYINEIAEWPAPYSIIWTGGNGRYAEINNWSITRVSPGEAPTVTHWQPSRFDSAEINNGIVALDAPGQHAGTIKLGAHPGDSATLHISDGWLKVTDETVGPGDGAVVIGADPAATATLSLSGGRLITKSLSKGVNGSFNFTGGVLSAAVVEFDLANHGGTIAPGNSLGQTHVVGDLNMQNGVLEFELAGSEPGTFDRIIIDGHCVAGGTLEVALIDGFTVNDGDAFDLLDFGSISGSFTLQLPTLPGLLSWNSSDLLASGILSVETLGNPDFDNDGDIDGSDLLVWQCGFGLMDQIDNQQGDANGDGAVDRFDLELWAAVFGVITDPVDSATPIPEPASWILLSLVVAAARTAQSARLLAS